MSNLQVFDPSRGDRASIEDICEETGLSREAVIVLMEAKHGNATRRFCEAISEVVLSKRAQLGLRMLRKLERMRGDNT